MFVKSLDFRDGYALAYLQSVKLCITKTIQEHGWVGECQAK